MSRKRKEQSEAARKPLWRLWLGLVLWTGIAALAAMGEMRLHAFAVTGPQFRLSPDRRGALRIEGAHYASRSRILRVFAADFGRSIFLIPLAERRRRLLGLDWVEDASVSRVWPDQIIVRVKERRPVAFVNTPTPRMVDAFGVLLDVPPGSRFAFPVLTGAREEQPERERGLRVRRMMRFLEDLGSNAKYVSEVDITTPENVVLIARIEGRAVELLMGDANFGSRFQNFLNHYPEIRKRSGEVDAFDLRLDDRITAKGQDPDGK